MNLFRTVVCALLSLIHLTACTGQEVSSTGRDLQLAFYNVENLFDTLDQADHEDDDFTPAGRLHWTTDRYLRKIDHIGQVFQEMGHPGLIGLAEVENRQVLEDLVQSRNMVAGNYGIVHFDSPDHRGIDVALLYDRDRVRIKDAIAIPVQVKDSLIEHYTTRDILHARVLVDGDRELQVWVTHWPSRRDGPAVSFSRQSQVAHQMRSALDSALAANPKACMVLMGDFNDEPTDATLREILGSGDGIHSHLFNGMEALERQGLGTYCYRGDWNLLDQILFTPNFLDGAAVWGYVDSRIYRERFMLYEDRTNGWLPNRTYGGSRYFGGYSDHLPVLSTIRPNGPNQTPAGK